jgi:hypothetical protein
MADNGSCTTCAVKYNQANIVFGLSTVFCQKCKKNTIWLKPEDEFVGKAKGKNGKAGLKKTLKKKSKTKMDKLIDLLKVCMNF